MHGGRKRRRPDRQRVQQSPTDCIGPLSTEAYLGQAIPPAASPSTRARPSRRNAACAPADTRRWPTPACASCRRAGTRSTPSSAPRSRPSWSSRRCADSAATPASPPTRPGRGGFLSFDAYARAPLAATPGMFEPDRSRAPTCYGHPFTVDDRAERGVPRRRGAGGRPRDAATPTRCSAACRSSR